MNKHTLMIAMTAAIAALSCTTSNAAASDQALTACAPQLIFATTEFPASAGTRKSGTVFLDVTIDRAGRVSTAEVRESSGYRMLDKAAVSSALSRWKFSTADCDGSSSPLSGSVEVQYQTKPMHALWTRRMAGYRTQELRSAAANGCNVSGSPDGGFITSCVSHDGSAVAQVARH